jgi:ABC-type Fe3+/spermidine/putrescine transport system ATPase subunit
VAFGLKARRVDRKRIRQAVAETLELVQLGGLEDRDVTTLSGGQQQRVALARALAIEPRVLLLDEPLSNLDAALRDETRDTLRALLARLYITTVFVTHDQLEALAFSDKIALMKDGRIVEVGYPRALYEQPAAEFTARFLGAANLFDGEEQGDGRVMVAGLGGEALEVGSRGTTRTGALRVMVRAEAVSFVEGPGPNTYAGQIIDRVYQGPVTRCLVRVGEHELRVHARRPPAESGVWVHLPADQVHVL